MFESEAIGPAAAFALRPAAVTAVLRPLLGTPIASADDAEAGPGGGAQPPAPRR